MPLNLFMIVQFARRIIDGSSVPVDLVSVLIYRQNHFSTAFSGHRSVCVTGRNLPFYWILSIGPGLLSSGQNFIDFLQEQGFRIAKVLGEAFVWAFASLEIRLNSGHFSAPHGSASPWILGRGE